MKYNYEYCDYRTEEDTGKVVIRDTSMCDGHHQDKVKIIAFFLSKDGITKNMIIQTGNLEEKPTRLNTEVFYVGELNHTHLLDG